MSFSRFKTLVGSAGNAGGLTLADCFVWEYKAAAQGGSGGAYGGKNIAVDSNDRLCFALGIAGMNGRATVYVNRLNRDGTFLAASNAHKQTTQMDTVALTTSLCLCKDDDDVVVDWVHQETSPTQYIRYGTRYTATGSVQSDRRTLGLASNDHYFGLCNYSPDANFARCDGVTDKIEVYTGAWANADLFTLNGSYIQAATAFTRDATGAYYFAYIGKGQSPYAYAPCIVKINSAGSAVVWEKKLLLTQNSTVGLIHTNYDTGHTVVLTQGNHLAVVDSAGALVVAKTLTGYHFIATGGSAVFIDAQGNVYEASGGSTVLYARKYDSGLNLVWEKTVTRSAGLYIYCVGLELSLDGELLWVQLKMRGASGSTFYHAIMCLPTSGNGTGAATAHGVTLTVADPTNGGVGAGSATVASVAGSIVSSLSGSPTAFGSGAAQTTTINFLQNTDFFV